MVSSSSSSFASPALANTDFLTTAHAGYMPLHVHQQQYADSSGMGGSLDPSRIPRGASMDMNKAEWTSTGVGGVLNDLGGYSVYGHVPGPPALHGQDGLGYGDLGGGNGYQDMGNGYEGFRSQSQ